jgi:hypothetical protein
MIEPRYRGAGRLGLAERDEGEALVRYFSAAGQTMR